MILIAFAIAFAIVAYFAYRDKAVRGCRWRKDSTRDKGSLQFYHCVACGAEAYTATQSAPATARQMSAAGLSDAVRDGLRIGPNRQEFPL